MCTCTVTRYLTLTLTFTFSVFGSGAHQLLSGHCVQPIRISTTKYSVSVPFPQLILIQKCSQNPPLIHSSSSSLEIEFGAAHMRDCGRDADSLPNAVLVPSIGGVAYAVTPQYSNNNHSNPFCLLAGVMFGHGLE